MENTHEGVAAIKKDKITSWAGKWMELTIIMGSKGSHTRWMLRVLCVTEKGDSDTSRKAPGKQERSGKGHSPSVLCVYTKMSQ